MKHRIYVGKDVHKFSSAHMTVFPDGTKERLHGHNFQVSVAVELRDLPFLDFAILKRALADQCAAWTERLLLPGRSPHLTIHADGPQALDFTLCGKRYVVPREDAVLLPLDNVVVETLAMEFTHQLVPRLQGQISPATVTALEVTVTESEGQGGVYRWTWS